ncbi:L-aspartate oxidase [Bifidobacterium apri]|uniref:L-aspartate oxidase n=1 Tax=Bifidobacterium apri TaxID=1769423 RepID=A0A6A2VGH7_9BIFI|nr:L-aspartate oxidase [Bifidobacterium apri]KAB8300762.1 L-aspartate oxidase [Bifidobacterium apri]
MTSTTQYHTDTPRNRQDSSAPGNPTIAVIGAGIAGLSAALAVANGDPDAGLPGQDVVLITKTDLVESNTYHAQGGIAAAIFPDDDPKLHTQDTLAAGAGLCEPKAVDILTREGAEQVQRLIDAGVRFDKHKDGTLLRGLEAAHSRSRVVHAGGDATGKIVELDVSAIARNTPNIHIIEHAFVVDLLTEPIAATAEAQTAGVTRKIRGVRLLDTTTGEQRTLPADRVILATGGAGRLYPYTTNPQVATGDGLAAAWRAGAQVADLEFYQFHPTALGVGEHFLISEAVRGEGAILLNERGERYMTAIDPRAELAPRDVVARENFRQMMAQDGRPVLLDATAIGRKMGLDQAGLAEFLKHRFPTIDAYTRSMGFDWSREPIPVTPAAHYWMGGIRTDLWARTSIRGLYAAGECARTGVQGANRLASNSLLEGLAYGRRAALAALRDNDDTVWHPQPLLGSAANAQTRDITEPQPLTMPNVDTRTGTGITPADLRATIEQTMWRSVGVLRNAEGLRTAQTRLTELVEQAQTQAQAALTRTATAGTPAANTDATASDDLSDVVTELENHNLATIGLVAATAALERTESRGAHARTDFPDTDSVQACSRPFIRG